MFMLSRCEQPLTLAQLVEIVPCDPTETMERIYRLAQLGLVSLLADSQPNVRPIPEREDAEIDDAVTLRPPAPPWRRRETREDTRTHPVKGRARTGFDVDPEPT